MGSGAACAAGKPARIGAGARTWHVAGSNRRARGDSFLTGADRKGKRTVARGGRSAAEFKGSDAVHHGRIEQGFAAVCRA